MLSLRRRAVIGGALSAVVAVIVGTYLLYSLMSSIAISRFDQALVERHTQLVVALNDSDASPDQLHKLVFDPGFRTPFSGRYWQVTAPDGRIYTSVSLLGETLDVPGGVTEGALFRDVLALVDEPARSIHQSVRLSNGETWGVTVAESRERLAVEQSATRRSLFLAFALLGMLGIAGTILQTKAIMHPLDRLRKDVSRRWDAEEGLEIDEYPEEVAPLVADINELLERNREIVDRARRQAADLAHALKTPSSILRNELTSLSEQGLPVEASLEALRRVDAQLGRSLARMRAANSGASARVMTNLSSSVSRFTRLFEAMAEREGKRLITQYSDDVMVRIDTQDIEEVMGNLLDNALKYCATTVSLTLLTDQDGVRLVIEDDGSGIPEAARREALSSGGRLDSSKPGTGLGLAIAFDLLHAYGAELSLQSSDKLGGLAVVVTVPQKLIRIQNEPPIRPQRAKFIPVGQT
ncbi:MAG: HAMP domain-containing sensor histidine kinase [Pseudomonadota bacterium]